MNVPNAPQPMPMSAPPPPPPAPPKSSAIKWILIGCGAFAILGVLACGGCMAIVYFAAKKMVNEAVAKVKPIIAQNETVRSEIGELKNVSPRFDFRSERHNGRDTLYCTLDVEGDRGKGTVQVKMWGRDRRNDEVFVTLTFVNDAGTKTTPIGTWRLYDDGKGNAGFTPVKDPPPDDAKD